MRNRINTDSLLCITACSSAAIMSLMDYIGGRIGMWFFPEELLPWLIGIVCFLILLIRGVRALLTHRKALRPFVAFGIAVLFYAVQPAAGHLFLIGFRDRILSLATHDDLRQIAQVARAVVPMDKSAPNPGKRLLTGQEGHEDAWMALSKQTMIDRLGWRPSIFVYDDRVDLWWGSALVGHWGCHHQRCQEANAASGTEFIDLAAGETVAPKNDLGTTKKLLSEAIRRY